MLPPRLSPVRHDERTPILRLAGGVPRLSPGPPGPAHPERETQAVVIGERLPFEGPLELHSPDLEARAPPPAAGGAETDFVVVTPP